MADDSRLPSYAVRPGVTFPDWAAVTSPLGREALLAIFEAFGVERTWRDYTRSGSPPGFRLSIDEAMQAGRAFFAPSPAGLEVTS